MRSSYSNHLTGRMLVFWIAGHLWEVVADESWSHMKVGRYLDKFVRGDKTVLAATVIFFHLTCSAPGCRVASPFIQCALTL